MNRPAALPRPGPRWGDQPQRPEATPMPRRQGQRALGWAGELSPYTPKAGIMRLHAHWLYAVTEQASAAQAHAVNSPTWHAHVQQLKGRLRREGLTPSTLAAALGCVSSALLHTHGLKLYPQQILAAALMLDQRLIELATGEGKSLAMAAAAAVAAMAGVPTHVITANDYLAQRDASAMATLWQALSLRVVHLGANSAPQDKTKCYQSDIVYTTAKEVAFDYLRAQLAEPSPGGAPHMQGLCLALLDEADSILLDEAVVPLIISSAKQESPKHAAQRRAAWWQAWSLAGMLNVSTEVLVDAQTGQAQLTAEGECRLVELLQGWTGIWQRPRLRQALVRLALTARHALQRDVHYLVREGRVELLDRVTGRVAPGRVLAQGLQTLIELKEGLPPSPTGDTQAQITFQRFFQRYWRLGGISGTLVESSRELSRVYDLAVVCLPSRHPSRRKQWPTRCFESQQARWHAVVARVQALNAQHRPVLVGTDTVEDSECLSALLRASGVAHVVLNAQHDQQEAFIVAKAGQAGAVTVATRMAGRGTDIVLDSVALQAGGLHVLVCQRNESQRMDRQLLGRCARQGQPGTAETWICPPISKERNPVFLPMLQRCKSSIWLLSSRHFTPWHQLTARLSQWLQEQRQAALRHQLLTQDQQWEKQRRQVQRS